VCSSDLTHRESAYKNRGVCILPKSEYLADNSILIPLYNKMTYDDIVKVAEFLQ